MKCLTVDEVWKVVPGLNGVKVSSWGRVQMEKMELKKNNGFVIVVINGEDHLLCDLVALAFVPNPSGLSFVGFNDGFPGNCCPDNLFWSPVRFFTVNKNSKLSKDQVIKIRELYAQGNESCKSIASKFNISTSNIVNIVNRKYWNF